MKNEFKDKTFAEDEIKGQELIDYHFINCKFIGTSLRFTSFSNCVFTNCDLSSVLLDMTSFVGCKFPESKLSNLDFSRTQLKSCDFSKAVMKNSVLQQLKPGSKNEKKKFDLSKSSFDGTDLSQTLFSLCELKGVSFKKANLSNAVFDRCGLKETSFINANISGINFTDSKIENAKLDLEGFIVFGNSKGFTLESQN
jgi:fluoroquinolone resistance protein